MKFALVSVLLLSIFTARSIKDTHTMLAQMDKSPFGSTLLSFVAMNLKIKSPVEEINLVIDQIVEKVETEQDLADKKNSTDTERCFQQIGSLTKSVADTTTQISNTETFITEKEGILSQAQGILKQAKGDYAETVQAIEEGTAQRESEHKAWYENDQEFNTEIVTLEQGVRLIQHMLHGVTFTQIKSKYNDVVTKLSKKDSKHAILFKPLVSQLSQISTQLNFDNVQKVLELLNNIRQGVVDERAQAQEFEDQAQRDWEQLLATLTTQKQQLQEKITAKTQLIALTQEQLSTARTSLANLQVSLENYRQDLKEATEYCENASAEYASGTAERDAELELLQGLQKHIDENISDVSSYVSANR